MDGSQHSLHALQLHDYGNKVPFEPRVACLHVFGWPDSDAAAAPVFESLKVALFSLSIDRGGGGRMLSLLLPPLLPLEHVSRPRPAVSSWPAAAGPGMRHRRCC